MTWVITLLVLIWLTQLVQGSARHHSLERAKRNANFQARAIIAQLQRVEYAAANQRHAP